MAACEIRILTEDDWALWRDVRLRSLVDAPDAFGSKLADSQGTNDREDRWRTRFDNAAFNAVALYALAGFALVDANPDDNTEDMMARDLAVSRRCRD